MRFAKRPQPEIARSGHDNHAISSRPTRFCLLKNRGVQQARHYFSAKVAAQFFEIDLFFIQKKGGEDGSFCSFCRKFSDNKQPAEPPENARHFQKKA